MWVQRSSFHLTNALQCSIQSSLVLSPLSLLSVEKVSSDHLQQHLCFTGYKKYDKFNFNQCNGSVGQTAEGFIYLVVISIYIFIRYRWFMRKNRTQTLRQGVILSQVVSVPLVWLHKSVPWALLDGYYCSSLNPKVFYLPLLAPSHIRTGDIFCLIIVSFKGFFPTPESIFFILIGSKVIKDLFDRL